MPFFLQAVMSVHFYKVSCNLCLSKSYKLFLSELLHLWRNHSLKYMKFLRVANMYISIQNYFVYKSKSFEITSSFIYKLKGHDPCKWWVMFTTIKLLSKCPFTHVKCLFLLRCYWSKRLSRELLLGVNILANAGI